MSKVHDVRAGGMRIRVREVGTGDPLLLVNGIGCHLGMWGAVERALKGRRLIAFDAPGVGGSQTPIVPPTLDGLGRLALEVLDAVEVERADVLGYSFGGMVAQRVARHAPHRVRRLVLVATTPGWGGVPGSPWALAEMATPLRYYWRGRYELIAGRLMGGTARTDKSFVTAHARQRNADPPGPYGYAGQIWAVATDPGSLSWLPSITCPALVVTGDDDPIMPLSNAMLLARRLGDARMHVAAGEGHLLLYDEHNGPMKAIRSFLSAKDAHRSAAWRNATVVTGEMLRTQVLADNQRARLPQAAFNAVLRRASRPLRSRVARAA